MSLTSELQELNLILLFIRQTGTPPTPSSVKRSSMRGIRTPACRLCRPCHRSHFHGVPSSQRGTRTHTLLRFERSASPIWASRPLHCDAVETLAKVHCSAFIPEPLTGFEPASSVTVSPGRGRPRYKGIACAPAPGFEPGTTGSEPVILPVKLSGNRSCAG